MADERKKLHRHKLSTHLTCFPLGLYVYCIWMLCVYVCVCIWAELYSSLLALYSAISNNVITDISATVLGKIFFRFNFTRHQFWNVYEYARRHLRLSMRKYDQIKCQCMGNKKNFLIQFPCRSCEFFRTVSLICNW